MKYLLSHVESAKPENGIFVSQLARQSIKSLAEWKTRSKGIEAWTGYVVLAGTLGFIEGVCNMRDGDDMGLGMHEPTKNLPKIDLPFSAKSIWVVELMTLDRYGRVLTSLSEKDGTRRDAAKLCMSYQPDELVAMKILAAAKTGLYSVLPLISNAPKTALKVLPETFSNQTKLLGQHVRHEQPLELSDLAKQSAAIYEILDAGGINLHPEKTFVTDKITRIMRSDGNSEIRAAGVLIETKIIQNTLAKIAGRGRANDTTKKLAKVKTRM